MTRETFIKAASSVIEKRAEMRKTACKIAVANTVANAYTAMEKRAQLASILKAIGTKAKPLWGAVKGFGRTLAGKGVQAAEAAKGTHLGELAKAREAVVSAGRDIIGAKKSLKGITSALEAGGQEAARGASRLSALGRKAPSSVAAAKKTLKTLPSEMSKATGAIGNAKRQAVAKGRSLTSPAGKYAKEVAKQKKLLESYRQQYKSLQELVKLKGMTPELQAEIASTREALAKTIANNKNLLAQKGSVEAGLGGLQTTFSDAIKARNALSGQTAGFDKAIDDAVRRMWLARGGAAGAAGAVTLPFALSTYGGDKDYSQYAPSPFRFGAV